MFQKRPRSTLQATQANRKLLGGIEPWSEVQDLMSAGKAPEMNEGKGGEGGRETPDQRA